jgi:uncharacterized membrane-anchored protein
MSQFAEMIGRIPRIWLFAAAGLIQVFFIAMMISERVYILRTGTDVILKTRAVDPRDYLRGDYVTLAYTIESVDSGALKDTPSKGKGMPIFVKLAKGPDGFHKAVSAHIERVSIAPGEVLIRGFLISGENCGSARQAFCSSIQLAYGLEQFFVPQGEGREIEKARNEGKLAVIAIVTSGGKAAIKRLLIDGTPVYDEPLF